jgi:hypothetical protein
MARDVLTSLVVRITTFPKKAWVQFPSWGVVLLGAKFRNIFVRTSAVGCGCGHTVVKQHFYKKLKTAEENRDSGYVDRPKKLRTDEKSFECGYGIADQRFFRGCAMACLSSSCGVAVADINKNMRVPISVNTPPPASSTTMTRCMLTMTHPSDVL